MKQKFLNLLIFFLVTSAYSDAQDYKVKEMKRVMSDLSASTHQRLDSDGIACGLVKVHVGDSSIDFGTDVVGSVDNKVNEYWVYLPTGSKSLIIKRSNFLPMQISFKDYGIDEIESKVTYSLELKEISFNREKCTVIINVLPQDATLMIDGIQVDKQEGGSYRLYLAKGEHVCRIDAQGYSPAVEFVTSGKGLQNVDVSLESLMASVKIKSKTEGALLFIDGKKVGISEWEGQLAAGKYTVEAKKDGFSSVQQDVLAVEKGMHYIEIPSLKQLSGTVRLISNISSFKKVLLDGKPVEMLDNSLYNIPSGKHLLTLSKYGYSNSDFPFMVRGEGEDTIHCVLIPLPKYKEAVDGDGNHQLEAAKNSEETKDFEQAVYWYSMAIDHLEDDGNQDLKTYAMNCLARLYSNKETSVYNIEKAKKAYLRIVDYKLLQKKSLKNTFMADSYIYGSYYSLGDMYKNEAQYNEAIEWYIKCLKYDDGDRGLFSCLDLGDCYMKTGNKKIASEWYKKAISSRYESVRNKAQLKLEAVK